jgi:flagellar basal-body rod protein FlgB
MPRPLDALTGQLQQVLDLRAKQQALVASNLANADTPGFRARRLDFKAALDAMFQDGPDALRRTQPGHAQPVGGDAAPTFEIAPQPWSLDGNSVNPEEEMVVLSENHLMFNTTVEVLSRRLALLEYAASDGGK